jgi:hypothetical protein
LLLSNNYLEVIIIVSSLFVVNNMLQLLIVSCSKDEVLVNQGVEVVDLDLALYVAVFENRVQPYWVIRDLC